MCPVCNEKRILYFGDDPTIVKMILSKYGITQEINERLDSYGKEIDSLKKRMDNLLRDAKEIMTKALESSLQELIEEHEKNYHGFGGLRESR